MNSKPVPLNVQCHDSLVLPTDSVPIADEYWSLTSSGENLFPHDVGSGLACNFPTYISEVNFQRNFAYYPTWYRSTNLTITPYDGYSIIKRFV